MECKALFDIRCGTWGAFECAPPQGCLAQLRLLRMQVDAITKRGRNGVPDEVVPGFGGSGGSWRHLQHPAECEYRRLRNAVSSHANARASGAGGMTSAGPLGRASTVM
jgi:hypothetical protein